MTAIPSPLQWYAGIGSRRTPQTEANRIMHLANYMGELRFGLRSGGARGADTMFERGAAWFAKDIIRGADCTSAAMSLAASVHPAWDKCSDTARKLLGRNVMIILGRDLKSPVKLVVFWTDATPTNGGTWFGVNIAKGHGIPVFNLADHGAGRDAMCRARAVDDLRHTKELELK